MNMNGTENAKGRRRWLRAVLVVVAILVVLVALGPMLASWTIARSIVAGAIANQVNGAVSVSGVSFGWFGPQRIEGLTIDDRAGGNRVVATVEVKRSLFSLITDAMGSYEIVAKADVSTTQAPDGTIGLARLAKPTPPSTAPSSPLPASLVASITLEPSSVAIDRGADGTVKLTNLAGTMRFAAADGSIAADLKGQLAGDGAGGPVTIVASLAHALDRNGAPSPGAMIGTGKVAIDAFAMRYDGAASSLRGFALALDAANAAGPMTASITIAGASREQTEVRDLAASVQIGRDPKGPAGLSMSTLAARVERGTVTVKGGEEPFTAKDLRAALTLGTGGAATLALSAETTIGARSGAVSGEGTFQRLFDDAYAPTLAVATGTASLRVERAIVPAGPVQLEIDQLVVTVNASEVSAPIAIRAEGAGTAHEMASAREAGGVATAAGTKSSLAANMTVERDPASEFGLATDPRRISGSLDARSIPSAILRPFMPAMDPVRIDPVRDLGPVVDLSVKAPGGAAAPLSLALRSARLNADLKASIDASTGSVRDGSATINATIMPELLAGTRVTAPAPLAVKIEAQGVSLPRRADDFDLAALSADATVAVDGAISVPGGDQPLVLSTIRASLKTARLADGARVTASAAVDGMPASVTADVAGLGAIGTDAFAARGMTARGTLSAGPIDWKAPPPFMAALPFKGMEYGLGASTIGAAFDGGMERGGAKLTLIDGQQNANATVAWDPASIRVEEAGVTLILVDRTLDALSLPMFRLAQPATVQTSLKPTTIDRAALEAGHVDLAAITFTVRAASLALAKAPGIEQPVTLTSLEATGTMDPKNDVGLEIDGKSGVADRAGAIASLAFGFKGTRLAVDARQWSVSVDATQLDGARTLAVAGVDASDIPGLAPGDRGTVSMRMQSAPAGGLGATFDVAMGALRGKGAASLGGDGSVTVPGADLSITLDAARATAFFAEEKDAAGRSLITRASAVPITLSLTDFSIPAPVGDEPAALLNSKGKARITTGNLDLEVAGIGPVRVGAIDGEMALVGGGRQALLRVASSITSSGRAAQPITIRTLVMDFVDPRGAVDFARLSLEGEVTMGGVPVALLDCFVDGDGIMADMFGPELAAAIRAVSPSGSPGTAITGTMKSEYMQTDLGRIAIDNAAFQITPRAPLTLALVPNETLRQRLLKPINPILEDIRPRKDQPIHFAVSEFSLPTTLDLSDLNAEFLLTVGEIEIQRADSILSLLNLVRTDQDGLVEGEIGPLRGTITDGRLSYNNFVISLGRQGKSWNQQLFFSGDVNLASRPPYATAINVDYPVTGIGRVATGMTRFDAFFGRINTMMDRMPIVDLNALRLRATFHGPIEPDRDLEMAFEPVLVGSDGSSDPGKAILEGLFGDKGLIRIPGLGGSSSGSGGSGTGSQGGGSGSGGGSGGTQQSPPPRDPVRGILDDIFKKR